MMRRLMIAAMLGGTAMLAAATPASATVTVGDGYGNGITLWSGSSTSATAVVGNGITDSEFDQKPLYVTVIPTSPLSAISTTSASDQRGGASAIASATNITTASFVSPASGSVSFTGSASASAEGGDSQASANGGSYFQYFFSSDVAATFNIAYALSGPLLGCCGNSIQLQDRTAGSFLLYHALYETDLTGTLTAGLIAGDVYGLTISKSEYSYTDAPVVRGVGTQSFTHEDVFNFSITSATSAVPEPATWAMMIGGFGVIGVALRRRQRANTTLAFA